ncbi:acyltransferase family protein [Pinibacter soli]|uniref:Acyltransferase n=1 Tax=Pinibacter soli TaxID=3044211 RepID=A0ABT6RCQ6_9BACT|nr:acyltransferase [Pinibacter soli]MDI3320352.1 acyltransferase [Pinibacter soli]
MQPNTYRIEALDSFRGIAAIQVTVHNFLLSVPVLYMLFENRQPLPFTGAKDALLNAFTFSPLHFVWLGHEPVIMFFVLSGFVLSIPFNDGGQNFDYKAYLVKRFLRLYIPYIIAIFLSILLQVLLYRPIDNRLSSWFQTIWQAPVSIKQLKEILLLKSDAGFHNIVPSLWSLVIEIKISLIFPLFLFGYRKLNFIGSCLALCGVVVVYTLLVKAGLLAKYGKSFETFYYLSFFVMGAFINFYKEYFLKILNGFSPAIILLLTLVAFMLSTFDWNVAWLPANTQTVLKMRSEYISAAAGMLWILLFLSNAYQGIALSSPLKWVGKISFSLYIVHLICLLVTIHVLRVLPAGLMIFVAFILSLIVAPLYYKLVEAPSLIFAKKMAGCIKKWKIQRVKS